LEMLDGDDWKYGDDWSFKLMCRWYGGFLNGSGKIIINP
jgi:hypothetical protein